MQPDLPDAADLGYADETERMQCEADAQAEAAYQRGLAEGRPAPDDIAILRRLLWSLPYWPTEAFAALDRIEGSEEAKSRD